MKTQQAKVETGAASFEMMELEKGVYEEKQLSLIQSSPVNTIKW